MYSRCLAVVQQKILFFNFGELNEGSKQGYLQTCKLIITVDALAFHLFS